MKKTRKYLFLVLIVLCSVFVITYGLTFAKYASNSVWSYYLKTKKFYFSSDYLNTSKNINNLWDGNSVHFNIKNSDNSSLITDYDINYKITCTIEEKYKANCFINGTDTNTYEGVLSSSQACLNNTDDEVDTSGYDKANCEINGYEWHLQEAVKDLYFDIVSEEEVNDIVVNIKAEAISPYKKTLNSEFHLHKNLNLNGEIISQYSSFDNYDQLIITNTFENDRCINISWNSDELRLDIDPNLVNSYNTDSEGYINDITINIKGQSNLKYNFYKTDKSKTFNIESFKIIQTDTC